MDTVFNSGTWCYAWHVLRTDNLILGFTDHDRVITVAGVECEPNAGFTARAAEAAIGLSADISQVEGALSSEKISRDDIALGKYDGARIIQFQLDWTEPENAKIIRHFHVGEITVEDNNFSVELRSFSSELDRVNGRYFRRDCDADLGDHRCKIDMNINDRRIGTQIAFVPQQSRQRIVINTDRDLGDQHFTGGTLEFTSGDLSGTSHRIATCIVDNTNRTAEISLLEPLPVAPSVHDNLAISVGCDKRFSTCRDRFANQLEFRGFPHIPSNDKALNYADSDAVLDGAPLVP